MPIKSSAYMEGKRAAYDAMNPYQNGTTEYRDWEFGWSDGDDEACAEDDWAAHEYEQDRQWYRRSHEQGGIGNATDSLT